MTKFEKWKKLRRTFMELRLPVEIGEERRLAKEKRWALETKIGWLRNEMMADLPHYPEYRAYRISKGLPVE